MNRTVRRKEKSGEIVAYSEMAIRHNQAQLEYCRTSMSALAGCTAGILGLTSYQGFVFFVLTVLVFWLILLLRTGPAWNKFFRSRVPILTGSLTGGIFTYVPFWTFIYGMVHVY